MTRGMVFDIKKFSLHDGPGIRTTVFLKGCPLRCLWCHNPESQDPKPEVMLRQNRCIVCGECVSLCEQGAISLNGQTVLTDRALCVRCGVCTTACYAEARELIGREMTVSEVMQEVERDLSFFDESGGGVTFSGGEPMMQPQFLGELLHACRQLDIHTAVDTSGYASWQAFDRIRGDADLFLYDLKLMDSSKHQLYTGVPNTLIHDNLTRLAQAGHAINIRLAVIPGVNDDEKNIRRAAEFVATLPGTQSISLLPYHDTARDKYSRLDRPYAGAELDRPPGAQVAGVANILNEYGLPVKIGG